MKNSIGNSVILTVFGESHGPATGVVLDGMAPGVEVSCDEIAARLSRRRPGGMTDTARVEKDEFSILSGVYEGRTTGTPLAISVPNANVRSSDYPVGIARPSHSDFSAEMKYHGYEDLRGGGHFSGRVTVGVVAAGAICLKALEYRGIHIATHILECAGVRDEPFSQDEELLRSQMELADSADFPVISPVADRMRESILAAKAEGDSVGGRVQCCISGLPAGVGEPWFDSLESVISRAMFAIGAVKGIEFGDGFELCSMRASRANDPLAIRDGRVVTLTNRNGGINGGISNGMPLLFQLAVKPTPSISRPQRTVDFRKGEETTLELHGRHDPAILRRICPVVTAMASVVVCDVLAQRYGTDYLGPASPEGRL